MNLKTRIKLSGIALVVGCLSLTLWNVYLLLTNPVTSGTIWGILSTCLLFVLLIYFANEVRKYWKNSTKR